MKNYVVWHCVPIANTESEFGLEPAGADGVAARYREMTELSWASAQHFLAGRWAPVIFQDPAETRVEMFRNSWYRIRDLWHQEPCNILYLDSDTIFVRPTEIFGQFDTFRLFNYSTPRQRDPFDHYFNAGVRYYPASMSRDVWDLGDALAQEWSLDIWDQEQVIFNHMLWHQNITSEQAHRPQLNWQAPTGTVTEISGWSDYNGCGLDQAQIIHYHATRSSDRGIELARALFAQCEIPADRVIRL